MNAAVTNNLASAAVVVRRVIAASAEDLFDAWLDPEALAQWMRPGTINSTVARVEPRVGGAYEITMQGQSGPIVHKGVYRVIERPRRLVFTWISGPTENQETLVTVDFVRVDKRTEVIVTHEQLPEARMPSHRNGWTSGLEHLDEACQKGSSDEQLVAERTDHLDLRLGPRRPARFRARSAAELGVRGSRPHLRSPHDPIRWSRDQSPGAAALWPGPVPEGRRSGDVRKRRRTAAPGTQERQADAARSGWRSGNIAMDDRRAQLDRDGHRAVVVSEDVRRARTMDSPDGWASASTSWKEC